MDAQLLQSMKQNLRDYEWQADRQRKIKGTLLGLFFEVRSNVARWLLRNVVPSISKCATPDWESLVSRYRSDLAEQNAN